MPDTAVVREADVEFDEALRPAAEAFEEDADTGDEITVNAPLRGRDLGAVRKAIEDRLEERRLQADLDYLEYDLDD